MEVQISASALASCGSNIARYNYLLERHQTAAYATESSSVIYPENLQISIELPYGAISIPLPDTTNFNGCTFNVLNTTTPDICLFALTPKRVPTSVFVSKRSIETGFFTDNPELATGVKLLAIEDESEWVNERVGYTTPFYRRDILLLEDGIAQNKTISTYYNRYSQPRCMCYEVDDNLKTIQNINLVRQSASTFITNLLNVTGQNNVQIKNIIITTPTASSITAGDNCLRVHNSTNVHLKNIAINKTYSTETNYGYGYSFQNVWNVKVEQISENGSVWGIFGNSHVNQAEFLNCNINQCNCVYGKDLTFCSCQFRNLGGSEDHTYNRFTSIYGNLEYNNCTFNKSRPVLIDSDYNSYTPFNLLLSNCTVNVNLSPYNCIVDAGILDNQINTRPELSVKCWPNVEINNLQISTVNNVSEVYLFKLRAGNTYNTPVAYMEALEVNVVGTIPTNVTFYECNYHVFLANTLFRSVTPSSFILIQRINNS
jgi:hypothetical protein